TPTPTPIPANLVSADSRVTQAGAGSFDINMPLAGPSGIEDRISNNYEAVFTFDVPVTSGNVTVQSGTATVGAITFNGNQMKAQLSGVADVQTVVLGVGNINGDGMPHGDVSFGFLGADVNGNRVVDKPDFTAIRNDHGPVTSANFRNDVNADGTIDRTDASQVRANRGHSLP
ncbi:MAG: dockerin type I domain-containing protein, partial [Spartobacteria bacterium]